MVDFDCYEELSQKRCLELNSDNLREKFQELSKRYHPDAGGDEVVFSRINRAHSILFNPSSRVEHLYELLFQDSIRTDGPLSSNVMELFSEIGELTILADGLIKKREKTLTSLGEALIAKDMADLQTQLFEMNGKVRGAKSAILETFPVIDQLIPTDPSAAKDEMELCARDLSFLSKWEKEIMSRMQSIL